MNVNLKVLLLKHLLQKKENQGFTLIELLAVIIIIGILAAIFLPNFLSCGVKSKAAEARSNVRAGNRAQQDYYSKNGKFANTMNALKLGFPSETHNYRYQIVPQPAEAKSVMITAQAKDSGILSFTGVAIAIKSGEDYNTVSGICQTDKNSATPPAMPLPPRKGSQEIQCPQGSHLLKY